MNGKREDRHYYDLEFEALFFSFFPFIFFFPGSNSCFPSQLGFERHCKKMSVSAPQLVPQSLITYLPPRPDLIRTALIYGCLPGVRLSCQLLGKGTLWGSGRRGRGGMAVLLEETQGSSRVRQEYPSLKTQDPPVPSVPTPSTKPLTL